MWHIFQRPEMTKKSPRLPRISPHIYHQKTTFCTRVFAKPPAKTHFFSEVKKHFI